MCEDVDNLVSQDRSRYVLVRTTKDKEQTSVRVVNLVDRLCVERKKMERDVDAYLRLVTYHRVRMIDMKLLKPRCNQNIHKNINRTIFFFLCLRGKKFLHY